MDNVLAVGKPTVILLMVGSSVDISPADRKADAVMLTWYPGARGGTAVADLLFGKVSPSGKLPVTFYTDHALSEMPAFTDYSMKNRTYRYYTGTPLYPFGYGLSYADMEVTSLSADRKEALVTVVNHSDFAAEEVLELYLKDNKSPDAPFHPILCGFKRIRLAPGGRAEVRIPVNPLSFTVVTEDGER